MKKWLALLDLAHVSAVPSSRESAYENVLLLQQLAVMKQTCPQPLMLLANSRFWSSATKFWLKRQGTLHVVKRETVVPRRGAGFRQCWTRGTKRKGPDGQAVGALSLIDGHKYLLHYRDRINGAVFRCKVALIGITEATKATAHGNRLINENRINRFAL